MPELAEVEFYRRKWNEGLGEKIIRVHANVEKRMFRGVDPGLIQALKGELLERSESSGKQMLFRFSNELWMGIHLGLTGELSVAGADHEPEKHDHLVLFLRNHALVFNDARQFGRVLLHQGSDAPQWWSGISPAVTSAEFTLKRMSEFMERHSKLPVKATLLLQKGFPGIGNWMADEILWRAAIAPHRKSSDLTEAESKTLWREVRFVSREALKRIAADFDDVPKSWLFHERWKNAGICPKHKTALRKETVGGRTAAWCPRCQR